MGLGSGPEARGSRIQRRGNSGSLREAARVELAEQGLSWPSERRTLSWPGERWPSQRKAPITDTEALQCAGGVGGRGRREVRKGVGSDEVRA